MQNVCGTEAGLRLTSVQLSMLLKSEIRTPKQYRENRFAVSYSFIVEISTANSRLHEIVTFSTATDRGYFINKDCQSSLSSWDLLTEI